MDRQNLGCDCFDRQWNRLSSTMKPKMWITCSRQIWNVCNVKTEMFHEFDNNFQLDQYFSISSAVKQNEHFKIYLPNGNYQTKCSNNEKLSIIG